MPKKKPIQSNSPAENPLVTLAWEFRDANSDLSLAPAGMGIWFAPDGKDTLAMTLAVPEGLTWAKYKKAWRTIKAWRERLTALMGRHAFSSHEQLYRQLAAQHPQRSYSQLADLMNGRIETILKAMLGGHRRKDTNQIRLCALVLRHHLSAFHVKPHDLHLDDAGKTLDWKMIELWALACCKRLALGQPAFAGNSPIRRDHIVERLRPYRRQ